jgi:transcriptional regulator with XRE-family HTH domain
MSKMTRLRYERRRRDLRMEEVAVLAQVGVADVSRIETRRLIPYPGQAKRLAKLFGLRPEQLQQEIEPEAREKRPTSKAGCSKVTVREVLPRRRDGGDR